MFVHTKVMLSQKIVFMQTQRAIFLNIGVELFGVRISSVRVMFREIFKTFKPIPIFDPTSEFLEMAEVMFFDCKLGIY